MREKNNALSARCNWIRAFFVDVFRRAELQSHGLGDAQNLPHYNPRPMIGRDNDFARRLLAWYDLNRRDLPWRVPHGAPRDACPDAYHVLVSEAMLQQTHG